MTTKREAKLVTGKDWDPWLNIVKGKARAYQIWNLIDPSLAVKPTALADPVMPQAVISTEEQSAADSTKAMNNYKQSMSQWKALLTQYTKQTESFSKIVDYIYDTVSITNHPFLEHTEPHPWDMLRALKSKLAPTDSARTLEYERLYKKLSTGPTPKQNPEAWLEDYVLMLPRAKNVGVAEAKDTRRAYRDFILAIHKYAQTISEMAELNLDNEVDHETAHQKLIEQFRHYIRLHDIKHAAHSYAFAAAESRSPSRGPSFRNSNKDKPKCICGLHHYYSECSHLFDYFGEVHPQAPKNWKPKESTKQKIKELLDKDSELRSKIQRAIEKSKRIASSLKDDNSSEQKKDDKDGNKRAELAVTVILRNNRAKKPEQPEWLARLSAVVLRGAFAVNTYLRSS